MQENTFIDIHNLPASREAVNTPHTVNIHYEFTDETVREGTIEYTVGRILGLTITNERLQNESGDTNLDITTVLQQVDKLNFDIIFEGKTQNIELEILSKSRLSSTLENDFFHFKVKPLKFTAFWASGQIFESQQLYLSPIISNLNYTFDNYNPLLGNSISNRPSSKRQVANRVNFNTNPVNSASLFSETATPAEIPDSNYSLTGLVNSRYEGSKTDAEKFGGVSPSFTGRSFIGEVFSNVVTDLKISSSLEQDRVYKELFHTGPEEFPTFKLVSSSLKVNSTSTAGTSTLIGITPLTGSDTNLVDVGDILFLTSPAGTEFVRLQQYDVKNNRIRVERGYLSDRGITSQAVDHNSNTLIRLVQPTQLFEFGSGTTKIELAENAKILVKESRLILETDKYGNVFTSSSIA